MRRLGFWLVMAVLTASMNGVARASCGLPNHLAVSAPTAAPGSTLTVTGDSLSVGRCYDDGGCHRDAVRRARGARLELRTAGRTFDLGEFEPDADWRRTKQVLVPEEAEVGAATLSLLSEDGTVLRTLPLEIDPSR